MADVMSIANNSRFQGQTTRKQKKIQRSNIHKQKTQAKTQAKIQPKFNTQTNLNSSSPVPFASIRDKDRKLMSAQALADYLEKDPSAAQLPEEYEYAPSLDVILGDIRFMHFPKESVEKQREIMKLMIKTPIHAENYAEFARYVNEKNSSGLLQFLESNAVNEKEFLQIVSKNTNLEVELTKDIDTVLDMFFEQEYPELANNLLQHLISMDFPTRESFDIYVKWYSSLTPEQKMLNIPECVWGARNI